ncbi:MAG: molybdopterin molybdotransferase MoeA [Actinomycetota bacterium]|nr:molybdopterin molybdotransferase MoeA [Actinomycetota bacterium]
MIKPQEALRIILESVPKLSPVPIPLAEIDGYVLAEDIVAAHDVPPFDNSAMDGYALLAADIAGAGKDTPVTLKLIEEQPAGKSTDAVVTPGTAIKIMTGAPIPAGADVVVPIERTRSAGDTVEILAALPVKNNIRAAGEDMPKGSTAATAGAVVTPVVVGLLASLGFPAASACAKPRVAVIGTGNELIPVDQPLTPGKIRDSNSYTVTAQARGCGAIVARLGVAGDTKEDVARLVNAALADADVVVTSGGVSVGDYDFVKDVLAEMGAELKFWGVKQKPGKPLAFWTLEEKLIFGLPGNPVATVLCFEEYVRPALLKMMGRTNLLRPVVTAGLTHDLRKKPGRQHFIGVRVEAADGRYKATVNGRQGSGILKSLAGADGIAIVPEDVTEMKAGEELQVQLIGLPEDH